MTTPRLLEAAHLDYRIVVEPRNYDEYAAANPRANFITLPENRQGVSYVRNFILKHAYSEGHEYTWALDDDIRSFKYRSSGKAHEASARNALSFVEHVVSDFTNIGAANIADNTFAYGYDQKPPLRINGQVCSVMYLRTDTPAQFRPNTIEDTDYSLQLLHHQYCTLSSKRVTMVKAPDGKLAGGLSATEYPGTGQLDRILELGQAWPHANFRARERNGRWTMSPNRIWSKFPQRPQVAVGV